MTVTRDVTPRIGGHLVSESLAALGAEVAFGVPGIHSLAIWEALRPTPLRCVWNAHRTVRGVRRRWVCAILGPASAAAALDRAGSAQLADATHGGGQRPRARGGDLEPDPQRPGRTRPRLPARADRPAASFAPLVKAARGPRAPTRSPSCWPRRGDGLDAAERAGVRRDPRRPADRAGPTCRRSPRSTARRPSRAAATEAVHAAADLLEAARAAGDLGRRGRCSLGRRRPSCASWPSGSTRPSPPPTWARAHSPTTIRWPPAAAATRRPSRSCWPRPTWCCASAPSSAPRRPASTR